MTSSIYINTALGSCLTIILIFVDYIRKFNTDNFQRKLLLALLFFAFISVITDFISHFLAGTPGRGVTYTMYTVISLFLVTQNCTYYLGAVFIDYFAYKNIARSKKFIFIVCVFLALHSISVIANLPTGYYFHISAENYYTPGAFYLLRLLLSYSSILLIIVDVSLASKYFRHSQAYLIIFFIVITGMGAALDIVLKTGSLTWPCFAAAILYLYFFIIQSDSKLDSLTGIGNRYSFNEFIDKLSRQSTREEYSIVMIDMDKFKEINDTLGHLEGDNALRDMAAIIKGCIRHSDFAARYGGDEFVLATQAEYDIQRLMDRIDAAIKLQNEKRIRPYQIYMSYGYDVYITNSGQSIQDFLTHIDAKMYAQKEERKRAGIPSAITGILQQKRENKCSTS
ncbi:MAG: GGDEF domain-containing protein [Treponema sp.]|jgi:diguanylate cyclase (GGDEF)-like protein|nr:GGDEF domain-containing protein [Treponema sp.]